MNAATTASRKIFAGPRLKRLRRERRLTQAGMAAKLDVSPSYLNLMERNQRPITVRVLIRPPTLTASIRAPSWRARANIRPAKWSKF